MTEIQAKQAVAALRILVQAPLPRKWNNALENARAVLNVIDLWEAELQATRDLHRTVVTEATGLDTRDYWVVADTEIEYAVPDGYEREVLKAGSRVWLARWTEDQLEAARRDAEELHKKLHPKE